MKTRAFAFFVFIAYVLSLMGYSLANAESTITAKWECSENNANPYAFPTLAPPTPVVTAWIMDTGYGQIQANGIVKYADYRPQGLEHHWYLDFNPKTKGYSASFIITPSGTGLYYHFGDKKQVKASLITKCRKAYR